MPDYSIPLQWRLGFSASCDGSPQEWVPASVPGAVQLDWAAAHGWELFSKGRNSEAYAWMEDVYWIYEAHLHVPELSGDQQIVLHSDGIDYRFLVRVNGLLLYEQEGMFSPFSLDLSNFSGMHACVEIRVFPAPKSHVKSADRTQANRSCKPPVSYGWDFHPRLIPLGIWQDTGVAILPRRRIAFSSTEYELSETFDSASVNVRAHATLSEGDSLEWELIDPAGQTVATGVLGSEAPPIYSARCTIPGPQLWWPHDQGKPSLYLSRLLLRSRSGQEICSKTQGVGFRSVRLVMNEGAWDEPADFPKSRSHAPITLEINGRRIFAKGSNWVSPDIFPGRISADTYRPLLELVRDSHMNILRIWGGAIVQKEAFYEMCDRFGIMVWQEFPLACNEYPDAPGYLAILEQEARSIIRKLKPHPSVVMWCGGNELFNSWSGMTDQAKPLRLLNKICYEDDPSRPFISTSPLEGMAHGGYFFQNPRTGEEAWSSFQKSHFTAYTEFGCTAPASVELLREIIPPEELFPPRLGTAWETHHGLDAFFTHGHLFLPSITHYFGEPKSLEELVENGQLLQCEGYKGLFEEVRRQKPHASMAINWCLNEPWPAAANNSIISWPCRPKPALQAVSQACRPVLASARIPKFLWLTDEYCHAEIWILNDSPLPVPGGEIAASIETGGCTRNLLVCSFPDLPPGQNWRGPRLQSPVPETGDNRFRLILDVKGRPELGSVYVLTSRHVGAKREGVRPMNL